jgi:hypothetical protein
MTRHQFDPNLYHKKKEKSKNSTKYCGPGYLPMQYLDVLKKSGLLSPGQNQAAFHRTATSRTGHWQKTQIRLFQHGWGEEEGIVQKKINSIS